MILAIVYFLALAAMVLWPSPVDRPVDGALFQLIGWLHSRGVPQWFIGYRKVEFVANILLFVPFGAIVASRLPLKRWWLAPAAAAALSSAIELGQALLLPQRVSDWHDIVANTAGALAGAIALVVVRALVQKPARSRRG